MHPVSCNLFLFMMNLTPYLLRYSVNMLEQLEQIVGDHQDYNAIEFVELVRENESILDSMKVNNDVISSCSSNLNSQSNPASSLIIILSTIYEKLLY